MADVLQQPIARLSGHPGSCLGAAWVAAVGTGLSSDWQGVRAFVHEEPPVLPNRSLQGIYDEAYADYRALYEALKTYFRRPQGSAAA